MKLFTKDLVKIIDYSLLNPWVKESDIVNFCEIEKKYNFGTVYVLPSNFTFIKNLLKGHDVLLGTGVSFPFGANDTKTKLFECSRVLELGADVVDFVINIGALKSDNTKLVEYEIKEIVKLASPIPVKVILEVSYLTEEEIIKATKIACSAGAAFVKTGTGFGSRGSTIKDVKLLLENLSGYTKIKVAGGITNIDVLLEMYKAGVSLFGLSKAPQIVDEFIEKYHGMYEF